MAADPERELYETLDDLDTLLKSTELGEVLTARGVNTSLALLAVSGLRSYFEGKKADAAEDFGTVAEEISARMSRGAIEPGGAAEKGDAKPS